MSTNELIETLRQRESLFQIASDADSGCGVSEGGGPATHCICRISILTPLDAYQTAYDLITAFLSAASAAQPSFALTHCPLRFATLTRQRSGTKHSQTGEFDPI